MSTSFGLEGKGRYRWRMYAAALRTRAIPERLGGVFRFTASGLQLSDEYLFIYISYLYVYFHLCVCA